MARPSHAAGVLAGDQRAHRTKAEIAAREQAERAFATGKPMRERQEVRDNEVAHREFMRVSKLLKQVGRGDALFEAIINRYCMLQAECREFERMREAFVRDLEELRGDRTMDAETRWGICAKMQQAILNVDKQAQTKRKMMLDIEKECAMTISSALRAIPKAPQAAENPLVVLLNDDA